MSRPKTIAPTKGDTKPLCITEDDREILLGLAARRDPLVRALASLQERQTAYLDRLAARLGIAVSDLGTRYAINVDTLTLDPIPAKPL